MKTINEFLEQCPLQSFDTGKKDLKQITGRVLKSLVSANEDPVLFRHGGGLVWLEFDDDGRPSLKEITQERMRYILARRFSWHRFDRDHKRISAWPPMEVVRDLLAAPNIKFPALERIVSVPVFAADGSIQLDAGYAAGTRSIYVPSESLADVLSVSDEFDEDVVRSALDLFDELVHDFPFVGNGKIHTLAALLVPFVRAMIKGPTPLHLFQKPEGGTGATLLVEVICDIVLGHSVASLTEAHNPDEFSRKIHSVLRSGPSVIFLDNLKAHVDHVALVVALTNDTFADRIIQRSEVEAPPVRCLWLGAANNPSLSREMVRRTIPIRLDAETPKPYLRTGFLHPNLREWVAENRPLLVWAMLNLVSAWVASGRPSGKKKLGMYESYSEVIGGIFDVAGVHGFLDFPDEIAALEDDAASDLSPLIPKWHEQFSFDPVGVSQLLPIWNAPHLEQQPASGANIRLGKMLRANRDRQFGDVVIRWAGERAGSQLWRLARIDGRVPSGHEAKIGQTKGVGELGESYTPSARK